MQRSVPGFVATERKLIGEGILWLKKISTAALARWMSKKFQNRNLRSHGSDGFGKFIVAKIFAVLVLAFFALKYNL